MPTICATCLVLAACSYSSALSLSSAGHVRVLPAVRPLHGTTVATLPQMITPTLSVTSAAARAGPLRMEEEAPFVENSIRFVRFFISTVTGLILGLLSPLMIFTRTPTLAAIGGSIVIGILVFFYLTLTNMQMTPVEVQTLPQDPSMNSKLNDIYGDMRR